MVKNCNFTYNNNKNMVSNKNFEVVILSDEEAKVDLLKGLLSKYYSLNIAFVCHHTAEAVDYLNHHTPMIFFLGHEVFGSAS